MRHGIVIGHLTFAYFSVVVRFNRRARPLPPPPSCHPDFPPRMIYVVNSTTFQAFLKSRSSKAKAGVAFVPGAAAAGRAGTVRNDAVVPSSA